MRLEAHIFENEKGKIIRANEYNSVFRKEDGFFMRWGNTTDEDPLFSPCGVEIVDIEISTICHGIAGKGPCKFCYKSNSGRGKWMSFPKFRSIFKKLPRTLMQIAFGIGDIDGNPDMWKIFEHCRENGVVPNVTINGEGLTDEYVDNLVRLCGAVAVSRYEPKDVCYDAVKRLTDAGLKQVNIHMLLAKETFESCLELLDDVESDPRLEKLRASVFLTLKQQGRGKSLTPLSDLKKYKKLVSEALDREISIGFDSCAASLFLRAVEDRPDYERFEQLAEGCESTAFSLYVDVNGMASPCSFIKSGEFVPINVAECEDFVKDVWYHPEVKKFRSRLLETADSEDAIKPGCRQCPIYDIY